MSSLNLRLRRFLGDAIARGREAEETLHRLGWSSAQDAFSDGGPLEQCKYHLWQQHQRTAHLAKVLLALADEHRPDGKLFENSVVCSGATCAHDFLHGTKRFTPYPCRVTVMIAQELGLDLDAAPLTRLSLVHSAPQAPDPN